MSTDVDAGPDGSRRGQVVQLVLAASLAVIVAILAQGLPIPAAGCEDASICEGR